MKRVISAAIANREQEVPGFEGLVNIKNIPDFSSSLLRLHMIHSQALIAEFPLEFQLHDYLTRHISKCGIADTPILSPVYLVYEDGSESQQVYDISIILHHLSSQVLEVFEDFIKYTFIKRDNNKTIDKIRTILDINNIIFELDINNGGEIEGGGYKIANFTCPYTRKRIVDVKHATTPDFITDFNRVIEKNVQPLEEVSIEDKSIVSRFIDAFIASGFGSGDDILVNGQNLLSIACKYGLLEQVKKLLALNADPNLAQDFTYGDEEGMSPFQLAVKFGYIAIVGFLLDADFEHDYIKADIEQKASHGNARKEHPIHTACFYGHVEIVELFLYMMANSGISFDINSENKDGLMPLYIAVCNNHLRTVRVLLELGIEEGLCINAQQCTDLGYLEDREHEGHQGRTALFAAAKKGLVDMVKLLLEFGANPSVKQDCRLDRDKTALDIAVEMRETSPADYDKIITVLEEAMAKKEPSSRKSIK